MGISIFSIIGLAIISAMLCLLLKQYRPEFAFSATLICGIVIFLTVIAEMTPLFDMIRTTLDKIQDGNEYTMVIIKALGICYVTQLASDTCQDAGERAMAGKIELAGRVAVLLLSLPMFSSILQIALELIG